MRFQIIFTAARRITIELLEEEIVYTSPYEVLIDGKPVLSSKRMVQSVGGLKPDTEYELQLRRGEEVSETLKFRTAYEFVTLDVRDFGAAGDGVQDDTAFLQAAITCCPPKGRVLVPEGIYVTGPLFLKSEITLELAKGAVLSYITDSSRFPILPGLTDSYDEDSEYNLGSWEGNPLNMFAALITGVGVHDVVITGEGTIEGNGAEDNWWEGHGRKPRRGAFRPRTIFLNHCENITVQGIRIQNSPSWTLHPYFSNRTRWIDLTVVNPKDSPNTDGMDPESVDGLEVVGVSFSLGDDCIAVKSGKMYMGRKHKLPSQNIEIRQCHMCYGHGGVTLGSEIGAGVRHLHCHHCIFEGTERGLRIKTRRGRGKDCIIDDILFEHIRMDGVMTPFAVNCYYWCCDPDGRSEYVRSKEPLPVDDRTPEIRQMVFKNIEAKNCHAQAVFIYGLPEQKIEKLEFEHVHMDFAENPVPEYPDLLADVEACTRKGVFISNCHELILKDVTVEGAEGEAFTLEHIDKLTREN